MCDDLVLRVVGKLLIPFILLFALYVQFHGDFGPGGGFQAGTIFAAGIVFYAIIFGLDKARRVVPDRLVETLLAAGVLLFIGVGVAGLLLGGNFLDYFVLDKDAIHGQHRGIFWVEAGVGITVSGVMLTGLYIVMARGNLIKKLVGLSVFQTSVYLLYVAPGKLIGGTAPILAPQYTVYSNPLPHVLILTAIVVGVATLALGLALTVRIKETYGTIEEDEITAADNAVQDAEDAHS